ncbi:glycine cleavage system protein GcvH [Capnocytophaga sp. oral taxon 338]|uniref:glycine cleavage system protein GcvH n=1 Tax=Capnocytophaga sp. oral taxon 338 TaxID=710239 RepID=UPI000202E519|nr:glycine cleavage system protein GcvH [Capnocytophaga sp. oral taxon 338]EGD33077.1 glycine cleavage system protein H [Capnocytophaga sp. oral taxon 338 str. F0234]
MFFPKDLRYTPEHLWVRQEGEVYYAGITDFAQEQLSDIVYVEVETEGQTLEKDQIFGTIEAVKTLSDLYMPLSAEIVAFNKELVRKPEQINKIPYQAWILQIKPTQIEQWDTLLTAEAYQAIINANND